MCWMISRRPTRRSGRQATKTKPMKVRCCRACTKTDVSGYNATTPAQRCRLRSAVFGGLQALPGCNCHNLAAIVAAIHKGNDDLQCTGLSFRHPIAKAHQVLQEHGRALLQKCGSLAPGGSLCLFPISASLKWHYFVSHCQGPVLESAQHTSMNIHQ